LTVPRPRRTTPETAETADPTEVPMTQSTAPVETASPAVEEEDDWLTGATACSIENGDECEACQ